MSDNTSGGGRYSFKKPSGERLKFPEGARTTHEPGRVVQTFDTLDDALRAARFSSKANRNKWADVETAYDDRKMRGEEWYGLPGARGSEGVRAVRDAITNGWPEGVEKMRAALADIGTTATPRNIRRTRRWADHGDAVEMPRVWAGRADVAWQVCHRAERAARQNITIAANITAVAGTDARELFWRGAAVLKLADLLTEAGYNVRIDALRYSEDGYTNGDAIMQRTTVKDHLAPLNLNSLAATVCLSGFFRVVYFQNMCHDYQTVRTGFGYSRPYVSDCGEIDGVEKCMNAEAAREWIAAALAKIEGREAVAA